MTIEETTGEIEVFGSGMLEVLSVGKGDHKLTVDNDGKGKALIEDMLKKGYSIFVETDDGPARVQEFNPHRFTYIISDDLPAATEAATETPAKGRRKKTKEVPVAGSTARAVGRTAGG